MVILAVLVRVELAAAAPLINLRPLANRLFRCCAGVMVFASVSFLGTLYRGLAVLPGRPGTVRARLGLSIFPEAIGVIVGAQVASRLVYP